MTGNLSIPINKRVGKEIFLLGAHRFHTEFKTAVELIDLGKIDVTPMISCSYSMDQAPEAFELAGDRSQAVKVQLSFASKC